METGGAARDLGILTAGVALGLGASWWLAQREHLQRHPPRTELKTIHVVGDVYLDMIAKVSKLPMWDGDTLIEMPIETHPGGSALNTAVQLASLINTRWREAKLRKMLRFDRCVLHSLVGDDVYGRLVTERVKETGVELSAPAVGGQGVCICLSGPTDRAFVSYRGTVERLCERDIDRSVLISERAGHVHFAAYYDCTGLQKSMPALMMEARAIGDRKLLCRAACCHAVLTLRPTPAQRLPGCPSPSLRTHLVRLRHRRHDLPSAAVRPVGGVEDRAAGTSWRAREQRLVKAALAHASPGELIALRAACACRHLHPRLCAQDLLHLVDVLICNQEELTRMTHLPPDDADSVDTAIQILLDKRCKLIVVTRGKEGAIAVSREERWEQPTMARQVVDTTGAGDAFAAGFLYGWCQAEDVRLGLIFGCACGAAAVGQMGGSHPLSPDDINRCMLGITPALSLESPKRSDRRAVLGRSRAVTLDATAPIHPMDYGGAVGAPIGLQPLDRRNC